MNVVEDNADRTVLVFRPRAWPLLAPFLVLTGTAGYAWHATGLAMWLITGSSFLLLSTAMFLALCFNRRTVTFDWARQGVDTRGHNWSPLFKDEVQHQSLLALARWTVAQDGNRSGRGSRVWTIGFERSAGKPVDELLFERELVEARCKALILGQHNHRPVQLVSPFDRFPGSPPSSDPEAFAEVIGGSRRTRELDPKPRPQVLVTGEQTGHLQIRLPTGRRKISGRGGLMIRWPLMLFEGVACLTIAVCLPLLRSRPHPPLALAAAYTLVGLPIFCAGCTCLWIGLRDLTGRTRIEVLGGLFRLTQTVLGGIPYRRTEVSAEECEATLVGRVGYNPCLLVLIGDRELCVGAGLPAVELLQARRALSNVVASSRTTC